MDPACFWGRGSLFREGRIRIPVFTEWAGQEIWEVKTVFTYSNVPLKNKTRDKEGCFSWIGAEYSTLFIKMPRSGLNTRPRLPNSYKIASHDIFLSIIVDDLMKGGHFEFYNFFSYLLYPIAVHTYMPDTEGFMEDLGIWFFWVLLSRTQFNLLSIFQEKIWKFVQIHIRDEHIIQKKKLKLISIF